METCKVFVGALPYDAEIGALEQGFAKWGSVVGVYYKGPRSGWATVEFSSVRKRDEFLKEKHKHKVLNKVVDVKKYMRFNNKNSGVSDPHLATHGIVTAQHKPKPSKQANSNKNNPFQSKHKSADPVVDEPHMAVITSYVGEEFGLLRTEGHGNGFFHVDSLYFCSQHRGACQDAICPDFTPFSDRFPGRRLQNLLPVGTQVGLLSIPINSEQYAFQASLTWPQLSKRPLNGVELSAMELLERLDLLAKIPTPSSHDGKNGFGCSTNNTRAESTRALDAFEEEDKWSEPTQVSVTSNIVVSCGEKESGIGMKGTKSASDMAIYIDGIDKLRQFFIDQFKGCMI